MASTPLVAGSEIGWPAVMVTITATTSLAPSAPLPHPSFPPWGQANGEGDETGEGGVDGVIGRRRGARIGLAVSFD